MKKFPKKFIAYQSISLCLSLLFFLICYCAFGWIPDENGEVLFVWNKITIIIFVAIFIGILLFSYLYAFFFYKKHSYEFTENEVIMNYGVIVSKKSILPYEKINNVKVTRNIIHWLFNLEVLKLDSGASFSSENPEIRLVDTPENIKILEKMIKEKVGIEVQEERISEYKFSFLRRLGYSYLRYAYLISLAIIIPLITLVGLAPTSEDDIFRIAFQEPNFLIVSLFIFLTVSIIVLLCCLVSSYIRFFNFKVQRNSNSIDISYGLFEKKKNVININKIRAIKICQSLTQRILKTATVKVEVIGFGGSDESKVTDVVIPYIKLNDLKSYFNLFFKEWNLEETITYAPEKNTLLFFVSIPFLITNLFVLPIIYAICVMCQVYLVATLIFLITNLFILIICYAKQKAQNLKFNNKFLIITNGYFSKRTTIINKKDVVSIIKTTTPIREKKNLSSIVLSYFNSISDSTETISLISNDCFEKIVKLIKLN